MPSRPRFGAWNGYVPSYGLLNGIPDPAARQRLIVAFAREAGPGADLVARFDIVLAADGRFGRRSPEYKALRR